VTLAATLLFRKLRIVAGVWEAIAQNGVGAKDGDLAANVVRAYSLLALAQAEEVTLQMGLAKRSPADYLSKVNAYLAPVHVLKTAIASRCRVLRNGRLMFLFVLVEHVNAVAID
jgi:hypothetical protein